MATRGNSMIVISSYIVFTLLTVFKFQLLDIQKQSSTVLEKGLFNIKFYSDDTKTNLTKKDNDNDDEGPESLVHIKKTEEKPYLRTYPSVYGITLRIFKAMNTNTKGEIILD